MPIDKKTIIAFDVFGTLIDTDSVVKALETIFEDNAPNVAACWRQKQLEYSFRRSAMGDPATFTIITEQALRYSMRLFLGSDPKDEHISQLMGVYRDLKAYPGTRDALEAIKRAGAQCYAFSNGDYSHVAGLMEANELSSHLHGIVSVSPTGRYKPDPSVYDHFCESAGARPSEAWLVSGNPFDIIGANSRGWKTVWINRSNKHVFDPWGVPPTETAGKLSDVLSLIHE